MPKKKKIQEDVLQEKEFPGEESPDMWEESTINILDDREDEGTDIDAGDDEEDFADIDDDLLDEEDEEEEAEEDDVDFSDDDDDDDDENFQRILWEKGKWGR
ncbi:MAG: hypothetical protein A2020_11255 [Lentisphaerae bacterium GWF2_45_14]|nr:MAG: hypothetical protein A2020_11255 [Lentisphaerae bacterium GWF2_45_14]